MSLISVTLSLLLGFGGLARPFASPLTPAQAQQPDAAAPAGQGVMRVLLPPDLQVPRTIEATVGETLTFPITARGRNGEPVRLRADRVRNGKLSNGAEEVSTYTFKPDASQIGTTFVIFTVQNEQGLATSLATKVIINPPAVAAVSPAPTPAAAEAPAAAPPAEAISPSITSLTLLSAPPVTDAAQAAAPTAAADTAGPAATPEVTAPAAEHSAPDTSLAVVVAEKPLLPEVSPEINLTLAEPAAAGATATDETQTEKSEPAPLREMVLAPMAGETLTAGQTVMLAWFAPELSRAAEQEIRLSVDGGNTYNIVITPHVLPGQQFFNWVVPDGVNSDTARIRVVLRDAYGIETTTDSGDFSVRATAEEATVSLLNLNGNETLVGGRPFVIRWQTNPQFQALGYDVTLLTGRDDFHHVSGQLGGETQEFTWLVPADFNTTEARIQVTAYNIAGQPIPVLSSADFSIVPEPTVSRVELRRGARGEQLIINGAGFIKQDSVVEINGVAFEPAYGRASKRGLTARITLTRSDLDQLLPAGAIATITVRHRASGVRSLPYLYSRASQ